MRSIFSRCLSCSQLRDSLTPNHTNNQAEREEHSIARTSYDLQCSHQKQDFLSQERQDWRRTLQRRYASSTDPELQSVRWLGVSHPPAGKHKWEDKLWRLISDKCYTSSGPMYQMRKAFFALDHDRSGAIQITELCGALEKWMNVTLTPEQQLVVQAKFDAGGGQIRYADFCKAVEDAGHPLGGGFHLNTG